MGDRRSHLDGSHWAVSRNHHHHLCHKRSMLNGGTFPREKEIVGERRERGRRTFQAKEKVTVAVVGRVRQGASLETGRAIARRHFSLCGGNVDVNGRQLREWGIGRHRRHRCPRICWDQDQVQKMSRNMVHITTQHLSSHQFFISQSIRSNISVVLILDIWLVQLIPNDGEQMLVISFSPFSSFSYL